MVKQKLRSKSKDCPQGKIYREGYIRHINDKNIVVQGDCIKATSQDLHKRSTKDKKYLMERNKMYELARQKFSKEIPSKCPEGTILREGFYKKPTNRRSYKRSTGTSVKESKVKGAWVPPVCVKSINREKKERLFVLEPNVLKKYGYENVQQLSEQQRHKVLNKALKDGIKPLSLFRRIIALGTLTKNTNPRLSELFREDALYVKTTKQYMSRETSKKSKNDSRSDPKKKTKDKTRKNSGHSRSKKSSKKIQIKIKSKSP